jgi:hypothetical protein
MMRLSHRADWLMMPAGARMRWKEAEDGHSQKRLKAARTEIMEI